MARHRTRKSISRKESDKSHHMSTWHPSEHALLSANNDIYKRSGFAGFRAYGLASQQKIQVPGIFVHWWKPIK